jgi:hypothetical protein
MVFVLVSSVATAASESRLSDEVLPYQVQLAPERPQPIEAGPKFLGPGKIGPGIELPGGAVWQPQLLIWGTARTAVQTFDPEGDDDTRVSDWSNRLDIFGEFEVSPTDRAVLGWSLFRNEGDFTGCRFEQNSDCNTEFDAEPSVGFIEFNFGEVWPNLDPDETGALDIEISGGRQPLLFQDGILINDTIDSVAITRNNITFGGTTNTRVTALGGFHDIHRGDNQRDGRATLGALLIETDIPVTTMNLDLVFVGSGDGDDGNSFHGGLSFIQRLGPFGTLFRALISESFSGNTGAARDGGLLFAEINWIPPRTHDNVYLNVFMGINEFTSAARDPTVGGPLGRTGVLFAAVGLGGYGAPLGNDVNDSAGAAIGYQMFFNRNRTWLNLEVGGRESWEGSDGADGAVAVGAAFQQALGRRFIARIDSFVGHQEGESFGWGARFEWLMKF